MNFLVSVMQTVNISEFRANLLKYLEVANTGESITVTSNNRLLATITPPQTQKVRAQSQLASLAANAKVDDVLTPIEDEWDALR